MITAQTASSILCCYREIQQSEELLKELETAKPFENSHQVPFDVFGRRPRALQLGVPSGSDGHRLYDVQPILACAIIRAHIAAKKAELAAANEQARHEASGQEVA